MNMHHSCVLVLYLFSMSASAEEKIWQIEDVPNKPLAAVTTIKKKRSSEKNLSADAQINLPREFLNRDFTKLEQTSSVTVVAGTIQQSKLDLLKIGETLEASVRQSVIAFPDEKSPVIAVVREGILEGWKLIGEARLEKNTQRIFIDFLSITNGRVVYRLKASGLSSTGQPGLTGVYYSQAVSMFAGEFISSFVAGYFEGLIPRQINVYGQPQADTSVDSALKKGASSGSLSSAEKFKEKIKSTPEFSEIDGPFSIKVLVLERGNQI